MMKDKSIVKRLCFLFLIATQLVFILYFGHQKRSFFCDEFFSYGLSNSEDYWTIQYDTGWVKKDYFLNYLEVKSGTPFSLKAPYWNQTNDVHPPLYYVILHIACCLFRDSYSKWIGIGVNFIFLLLTDVCIYKIGMRLSRDWRISLLIAAVWSFSAAGMNTALFIRMYMLQTLEILLLVLINIQIADKNFRMNFKERILISLNVIAGGLTHYYYYLFAGAMAISVFLYLLYHKRKQEALKYLNSYVIGGGINILVFPEAVNHIFREYRGVEVAHNLGGRADHPLKAYLGFINNSLFGGTLYLVLALFIISAVYCKLKISKDLKKQKLLNCTESGSDANCENSDRKAAIRTLDSGIKAIIISTIIAAAVFLYVAIVGSQLVVNRYIMPMYPFFAMGEIYIIYNILKNFGIRRSKILITAILTLALSIMSLKVYGIDYLYKGYDEIKQTAEKTTDRKDCLLYYTENRDVFDDLDLYLYYDETYIFSHKMMDKLPEILAQRETNNEIVVNIDSSLSKKEKKQVMKEILRSTGYTSYELLYQTEFTTVYEIR